MRPSILSFVCACLAAVASAANAGAVEVRFVNTRLYTDAGNTAWEEEANLQAIDRHLKARGQRWLPANHVLKVDVLDVDLAGAVRPFHGGGIEIRVLRGGADFPRIHLKYTLEADGKVESSGDEWLTDLDYSGRLTGERNSGSLHYEKRMIDQWFKSRLLPGPGSAG
ncbi:MAG: DUF3016 domain-containing protein [Ramlibacter sp.]|nr:DUF3016 domain-containing protein [Ramlibacter sp.]